MASVTVSSVESVGGVRRAGPGRLARLRRGEARRWSAMLLFGAGLLVSLGAGCSQDLVIIDSTEEFEEKIIRADKPALIMFYKMGCASCAALEPGIAELANEYKDRAVVSKYLIMNFFLMSLNPPLRDKYDLAFYPTVILFVDGVERHRWMANYDLNSYRRQLDELVPPPPDEEQEASSDDGASLE